jgi:hypothetical protein
MFSLAICLMMGALWAITFVVDCVYSLGSPRQVNFAIVLHNGHAALVRYARLQRGDEWMSKPRASIDLGDVFLAAVILPAARYFLLICDRLKALKAARIGHCEVCGYDLRATPNRCPECGTITGKN